MDALLGPWISAQPLHVEGACTFLGSCWRNYLQLAPISTAICNCGDMKSKSNNFPSSWVDVDFPRARAIDLDLLPWIIVLLGSCIWNEAIIWPPNDLVLLALLSSLDVLVCVFAHILLFERLLNCFQGSSTSGVHQISMIPLHNPRLQKRRRPNSPLEAMNADSVVLFGSESGWGSRLAKPKNHHHRLVGASSRNCCLTPMAPRRLVNPSLFTYTRTVTGKFDGHCIVFCCCCFARCFACVAFVEACGLLFVIIFVAGICLFLVGSGFFHSCLFVAFLWWNPYDTQYCERYRHFL